MARKLFIVARGNVATYESLRRSIGHEPGVEIVYDRRPPPRRTKLGRLIAGATGLLSRRRIGRAAERRNGRVVDMEIQRTGWAVVRRDEAFGSNAPGSDPPGRGPEGPGHPPVSHFGSAAPRLDHTWPRV